MEKLQIDIALSTGDAEKKLGNLTGEVKRLDREINGLSGNMDKARDHLARFAGLVPDSGFRWADAANRQLGSLIETAGRLGQLSATIGAGLGDFGSLAGISTEKAARDWQRLLSPLMALGSAFQGQKGWLEQLKQDLDAYAAGLAKSGDAATRLGKTIANTTGPARPLPEFRREDPRSFRSLSLLEPFDREQMTQIASFYQSLDLQRAPDPLEGFSLSEDILDRERAKAEQLLALRAELSRKTMEMQGMAMEWELAELEKKYERESRLLLGDAEGERQLTEIYEAEKDRIREKYAQRDKERRKREIDDILHYNKMTLAGYHALESGFNAMFSEMIRIQTDSNNVLIRGFTAMANAFITEVSRMIARWLAMNMIMHMFGLSGVSFRNYIGLSDGGMVPGRGMPSYSNGGFVGGNGLPTGDSLPVWLSSGEFVVNSRAVGANRPLLESINRGDNRIEHLLERIADATENGREPVTIRIDPLDPVTVSRLTERGNALRRVW